MSESATTQREFTVTVVPHTHWDREWYQPFAVFQARLVDTVDEVLELLDSDPQFSHFMLDGQAVVLDDYLAVRPEAEERLRDYVRSGRLAIGPWYTLPDEFLSSPEALVRNLLIGTATCRRFGAPMAVVYTPDSFGHVSQLPRLAHGFGFDSLVFERGVGDEGERLGAEFRWSTADGRNSVLAVHLLTTYSSGAGLGYGDWSVYEEFDEERAVAHARKALYGGTEPIGTESWLDESLARIPGGSSGYTGGSQLLLLNGSDHLPPQTDLPRVLELLNRRLGGATLRLGTLRQYVEGVIGENRQLPQYRGEFRGSRYHHVLSGVFSARIYLKQANHESQQALERYAEPLATRSCFAGSAYPGAVLRGAWKELLRNHCHDSICGCSIDQVHEEMVPRFAGVRALSLQLARKALAHLTGDNPARAPLPRTGERLTPPPGLAATGEPAQLTVFNPQPHAWRGVVEALLPLPPGFEPVAVVDGGGEARPAALELLEAELPGDARSSERQARVRWLADLAPLSVTSFRLSEGPADDREVEAVAASRDALENEHLRLELVEDGVVLHHKRSGERLSVALSLVDAADAGDEYDFSPLPGDEPVREGLGRANAEDARPDANGLSGRLTLSGRMRLPEKLGDDRRERRGESELHYRLTFRLDAGDPFVRLTLELENRARDHRLQLAFATDIVAESVDVEGHFDVLSRPIALPEADGWFQKPSGTNHQRRFSALGDGRRGVAILNAGLPEYAAHSTPRGSTLAVTLLRSVGWLSRNDLGSRPEGAGPALPTPGAQCLGPHRFELALMPFAGDWAAAAVPAAADRFTTPPLVEATAGRADGEGWLELPEGLLLSALKVAEEGGRLIVRFWNPGRSAVEGVLRLRFSPASVTVADFDEIPRREVPLEGTRRSEIPLFLEPKEVMTLAIGFEGGAVR